MTDRDFRARLAPILPLVSDRATGANERRRPDAEVFAELAALGLQRLLAPVVYGGYDAAPEELLGVLQTLAATDGSTGWTLMTLNEEVGIASAYLKPASIAALLTDHPQTIIAGSGTPVGRATEVEGGWRINGRWGFVTGANVADRLILASVVVDGADRGRGEGPGPGEPGTAERGAGGRGTARRRRRARLCFTLIPVSEVTIHDTWLVAGLQGTGSNDVTVDDVFVPDHWAGVVEAFSLPLPPTPFYCLPSGLRFPFPKVGVAAGIAGGAIAQFGALALSKKPVGSSRRLAERPSAQAAMAQAESLVGAGRSWALEQMQQLWSVAASGRPIEPELHARVRLACSHAVDSSIRAVEVLATAAGTSAGSLDGPWPRLLADVRAVGQHYMVGSHQMQTAGRVLLGEPADDPIF